MSSQKQIVNSDNLLKNKTKNRCHARELMDGSWYLAMYPSIQAPSEYAVP